jgi:hypothetical protein
MDKKVVSSSPATRTLHQRTLWVDGKQAPINPGMGIAAEIKTGKRRIIKLLSSRLGKLVKRVCGSVERGWEIAGFEAGGGLEATG